MGKRKRSGSFTKYEDGRRSDDGESQEETEDQVNTGFKVGQLNGLRYSARVQEKQEKLRRESSPGKAVCSDSSFPVTTLCGVHPCSVSSHTTGVVSLPSKASTEETCSNTIDVFSAITPPICSTSVYNEEKKKKRNWELWSHEDKLLFFEALNEYGKDFDAIQNYIASKQKTKNKGSHLVSKNKDQVRHFYYRTWNKISPYLIFPTGMKKAYQELYGLVNYGELRKKQRSLNEKNSSKLCELIEKGFTTIKLKGKTIRIKTPVCTALKKLNNVVESHSSRIPATVWIELEPADHLAWNAVQAVSHNPRARVHVPLHTTVAFILNYFENRWKSCDEKIREQMAATISKKPIPHLRLYPKDACDTYMPVFKTSEATSSSKISLKSFTENILKKEAKICLQSMSVQSCAHPSTLSCIDSVSTFAQEPVDSGYCNNADPIEDGLDYVAECVSDSDAIEVSNYKHKQIICNNPDTGAQEILDYSTAEENDNAFTGSDNEPGYPENGNDKRDEYFSRKVEVMGTDGEQECAMETGIEEAAKEVKEDNIQHDQELVNFSKFCNNCGQDGGGSDYFVSRSCSEKEVNKGWTAKESRIMTVGEIFMMLGQPEKISLVYSWDVPEEWNYGRLKPRTLLQRLIDVSKMLNKKRSNKSKASSTSLQTHKSSYNFVKNCDIYSTIPPGPPVQSASTAQNCALVQLNVQPHAGNLDMENNGSKPLDIIIKDTMRHGANANIDNEDDVVVLVGATYNSNIKTNSTQHVSDIISTFDVGKDTISSPTLLESEAKVAATPASEDLNFSSCNPDKITVGDSNNHVREEDRLDSNEISTPNDSQHTLHVRKDEAAVGNEDGNLLQGSLMSINFLKPVSAISCTCSTATISCSSMRPVTITKPSDSIFRKPCLVLPRPTSIADDLADKDGNLPVKTTAPKPFLDLPKGNRRLGRRPSSKRVVVPRVLPLLPKGSDMMLNSSPTQPILDMSSKTPVSRSVTVLTAGTLSSVGLDQLQKVKVVDGSAETARDSFSTLKVTQPNSSKDVSLGDKYVNPELMAENRSEIAKKESAFGIVRYKDKLPQETSISSFLPENSSDFEDLLKLKKSATNCDSNGPLPSDMDNLSLSSFMDISLPDPERSVQDVFNSEMFPDSYLDTSNSQFSLTQLLETSIPSRTVHSESLETPKKMFPEENPPCNSHPWELSESNEFGLASCFSMEAFRSASILNDEGISRGADINFIDIIEKNNKKELENSEKKEKEDVSAISSKSIAGNSS